MSSRPGSRAKTSSRLPTPLKNVSLEPLEPPEELRRIVQSPFANLRPLVVAPTLPPMVPTAWGGDRDDPFFQAPSFETIGKPIRLKFCKEWYEDFFGSAAKSIPDLLDANNWLPPGTPVRLKLPSKLRAKTASAEALPEVDHLESAPGLEVEAELGRPHWAAVQLQCAARSWKARFSVAQQRRQVQAQARIARVFRGHLVRTGRGHLVGAKEPMPPQLAAKVKGIDGKTQDLDLRHLCLGTRTFHLEPALRSLALKRLELMGNYLGSKGLQALAQLRLKSLQFLGLSWNGLGDEGCRHLAKIVQANHGLRHLDLRYNRIGDAGACCLARAVKGHELEILDLQEQPYLLNITGSQQTCAPGLSRDNSVCDSGAAALYNACGQRLQLKLRCNSVPLQRLLELQEELQVRLEEEHAAALERKVAGSAKKPKKRRSRTSSSAVGSP